MAENIRTTPLRLRPEEHRIILLMGDSLMALGSLFLALYTWSQWNLLQFQRLYDQYIAQGFRPGDARRRAERVGRAGDRRERLPAQCARRLHAEAGDRTGLSRGHDRPSQVTGR